METAPKDTPILAWCCHESDGYEEPGTGGVLLTTYGAHAERLDNVEDGFHILVWGGAYRDDDLSIPDWWFRSGSGFEEPAAPICWKAITG
ncbi:hypothetical protein HF290_03555 [Acidithiobacillus ferrooxidans]|nr:hypothetical protein [Acidithiobacillus ferrooxidans]